MVIEDTGDIPFVNRIFYDHWFSLFFFAQPLGFFKNILKILRSVWYLKLFSYLCTVNKT